MRQSMKSSKPINNYGLSYRNGGFIGESGGSPGRTRTCDQPVNSRLLYQLSYRGTEISAKERLILAKLFEE